MYGDPSVPTPGKMGSYAAIFVFAVGVLLSSFVWNTCAMRRPFVGPPVSFGSYFRGSLGTHFSGGVGGLSWGGGVSLHLIPAGRAGYAISCGLGQGTTLVAAVWRVFIWKEFRA